MRRHPTVSLLYSTYARHKSLFLNNLVFRKRLLTLAAQKFVSDIAADAYQHARIRTNAAGGGRGRLPIGGQSIRVRIIVPICSLLAD